MSDADVTPETALKELSELTMPQWARDAVWILRDALAAATDERDRLKAELSRLRSAPVEVEVPDLDNYETRPCEPRVSNEDPEDWYAIAQWESERADAWKAFAELNLQDPSRILKDGERAVPAEELDRVRSAGIRLLNAVKEYHEYKHDGDPWTEDARVMQETSIDELRGEPINEIEIALRSGEAEGRMG